MNSKQTLLENIKTLFTIEVRAWLYNLFLSAIPILTFYGLVEEQAAPLYVALVAAFLGLGMARANTSTKNKEGGKHAAL